MLVLFTISTLAHADNLHHQLQVDLNPETSEIVVKDTITLPRKPGKLIFSLHSDFLVSSKDADIERVSQSSTNQTTLYLLSGLDNIKKVQLSYRGKIGVEKRSGLFGMPKRVFNRDSLYLSGNSYWYPQFINFSTFSFTMTVNLPKGWEVISQGGATRKNEHINYQMPHAQDEIYLIGGPYKRYAKQQGEIELEVFLLSDNAELAEKYLNASAKYVDIYSQWIGSYPYKKFAVIENRWQTGYGMPSFTLLGSRVIRLPFILYTSLPHEILHNWWGNGIFVDYRQGNWSEGLTAYMADHFSSEQRGQASEYRRKALERYANFAAKQKDFALKDFVSRHNEASQSIGYSKSLMVFHMIRQTIGETAFDTNIKALWQNYQYQTISFPTLLRELLKDTDEDADQFIEQWINRIGAPEILLDKTTVEKEAGRYVLSVVLSQQQQGELYRLQVPVSVKFANGQVRREQILLEEKIISATFGYKQQPIAIKIDPDYDLFRYLYPEERPASLSLMFGAKQQILVYPSAATGKEKQAWQTLADSWQKRYKNITLISDQQTEKIDNNSSVWILGWQNKLLENYKQALSNDKQIIYADHVKIDDKAYSRNAHNIVLLSNHPAQRAIGFIGAKNPGSILKLARKLPHYGSYGRLVFDEASVQNILKQHHEVVASPLSHSFQ